MVVRNEERRVNKFWDRPDVQQYTAWLRKLGSFEGEEQRLGDLLEEGKLTDAQYKQKTLEARTQYLGQKSRKPNNSPPNKPHRKQHR